MVSAQAINTLQDDYDTKLIEIKPQQIYFKWGAAGHSSNKLI